jgi:hypothetical protein
MFKVRKKALKYKNKKTKIYIFHENIGRKFDFLETITYEI